MRVPPSATPDKTDLVYMVCDFIPEEVKIIHDPRIKRISVQESESMRGKNTYRSPEDKRIAYLTIEAIKNSNRSLVLEVDYAYGSLAGISFRFNIFRSLWGLRTKGRLIVVS